MELMGVSVGSVEQYPEGWMISSLGENGSTYGGLAGKAKRHFGRGSAEYVTFLNVMDHSIVDGTCLESVDVEVGESQNAVHRGDVLFTGSSETPEEVAMAAYVTVDRLGLYLNSFCFGYRIHSTNCLDGRFLVYLMRSGLGRRAIAALAQGSTRYNISKRTLMRAPLPRPPLSEQVAITVSLRDVDALLGGLDRVIAKKRDLKQAAMQRLLTGKTRLPGFSGDWTTKPLRDLVEIRSGGTPSTARADFWNGHIPWCTPTDITALNGYKYLAATERKISDSGLRASSAELIPLKSVIMTSRATIGECAINTVSLATSQGFKNFVPSSVDGEFLFYLMTTQKNHLVQLCGGSTFLEIGKKQLEQFEMYLPSDASEQRAVAKLLADMDAEIDALERRRAKAHDLKVAMMQELLTGKTRLHGGELPAAQEASTSDKQPSHSWAFNEAVVISTLVSRFGKEDYPLGRKRYTKLSYLLHRRVERRAEGYLKKAAGPYNPQTKYGGPEKIAKTNGYILQHKGPKGHSGFIAADNIAQAEGYFEKWYGPDVLQWLVQFRFKKNDELEVLATVDMASVELHESGEEVDVASVKAVIANHPEWEAKLDRAAFCDANIAAAIELCGELFFEEVH